VAQDAVAQDAVAQDALPHAFPETGASGAHADDGVHDAPAGAVADRDGATASGEIPPVAEREASPAPAASAMAPAPTESVHEPEPEPLSVPALDELRNDPAALLSRILAIIHVPTEDASEDSVSAPSAVGSPVEADASPDAAPETLSEIVAGSAGESAVMAVPPEDEAKPAPMDVGIESEADILPAPRPISVAEAVEEMLQKATARSAVPTRPGEAALAMMADPVPMAERGPKAAEAEKPADASQSFVMDAPGFSLAPDPVPASAHPPVRPAHSERKAPLPGADTLEHMAMDPVADHALPEVALAGFGPRRPDPTPALPEVALPAPEPSRPEPSRPESKAALPDIALAEPKPEPKPDPIRPDQDAALPDIALRESEAPAPTLSQELASVPAAPALPRFVAFPEMSPVAAPSSAKPAPVPAAPPVAAGSTVRPMKSPAAPRTDVLAAIAALSEEEKIALFS
jgi:hypothetical protein